MAITKNLRSFVILFIGVFICFTLFFIPSIHGQTSQLKKGSIAPEDSLIIKSFEKKNILVLNSYHENYIWSDRVMQGIKAVFNDEKDLEIFINYMDTKRCSDSLYFVKLKDIYAYKYANIKFDIILSADDHALNFLLQYRDTLFPETPVVFCGINDFQPSRIEGKKLITGVSESYDVKGTLEIILKLHPNVKNIKVIADGTQTGTDLMNRVKRAEIEYKDRLNFEYLSNLGLKEINKRLKNSDQQTAIIWTIYLRIPEGTTVTSEQSIKNITNNSSAPVYCIWDVVGKGVIGGKVTSPTLQGRKAAEIALRILHGEDLASFTVSGTPMVNKFDYEQLQRYGIEEKLLPRDRVMINRPFSVYNEYKNIIITTLSIIFLLLAIVFILIHFNKKRRQTAKIILEKNQKLISVSKELKETNLRLEEAKEKAEEGDRLKTAFLSNLSHEIRTPMNGILGFTNLLKDKNLSEDTQHQYIDVINQSSERMLNLIEDLVNISKIESGEITVNETEFQLDEFVDDVVFPFQLKAEKKDIKLLKKYALNEIENYIISDQTMLEKILKNLLNNALKFTKKGEVGLGYSIDGEMLQFYVEDTGPGIAQEKQELIFEKFRQIDDTYLREEEGSGLGLPISKAFVNKLGGKIWLESELGVGTKFMFTIPYNPVVKAKRQEPKTERAPSTGISTILVAEDDPTNLFYIKEILAEENIQLICASNGKEAIEMAAQNPDISLALMDVKMPVINGIDATREILKTNPGLPIIAQTAYASNINREKAIDAGCVDYITKPFTEAALKEKIGKFLKNPSS